MGRQQQWVIGAVVATAGALGVLATGLPTDVWQGSPIAPTTTIAPVEPVVVATTVPPTVAPTTTVDDSVGADTTTSTSPSTTSTTVVLPDRAAIEIVVGNAAGVSGLASDGVELLAELGYTDARTADALERRETTVVMYAPGFADAAARLATELGLTATAIDALGPAAVTDADGTFDLVVLLSTDVTT
jgi:hypothetical protein